MTRECDVAVVGAGFSGLASAILLGRLGRRVALVEANAKVGGLLRSYVRRGVDCPVGVHYFGSAGEHELLGQLFRVLEIRGLLALRRTSPGCTVDRYLFDDFEFDLPADLDTLETSLRERFGEDCRGIPFLVGALRAAVGGLRIDERGRVALASLSPESLTKSAAVMLSEHGCPEPLQRIVSTQGFLTGADLDHVSLEIALVPLASLLQSAWQLGCTGAQMADTLAERARAHGVQIVTGDRVEAIRTEGETARSLRLASGRMIEAEQFVSTLHPKTLFRMLPDDDHGGGRATYVRGLCQLSETPGVIGLVALVDPQACPALPHNTYRMGRCQQDGVYVQIQPSTVPGQNRLLLMARSAYQDWVQWHGTRTGKRGLAYQERKQRLATDLLRRMAPLIGHIDASRIVDIWTPLTVRDWTGAPEGGAYGVRHTPADGLRYVAMTRTPFTNLVQAGQSAIAPGLVGCSLAVIRALGDLIGRSTFREFLIRELHGSSLHGSSTPTAHTR